MGICKSCGIKREWIKDYCNNFCKQRHPIDLAKNAKAVKKARTKAKLRKKKRKSVRFSTPLVTYTLGMKKEFYLTKEWKTIRYQAIVKYGKNCLACGESSKIIHVDHIKPRSKYPHLELELTNLQVLCEDCNIGKSNKDETDWRPNV